MANEKTPVVWDDTTKKHRPLGTGEKMGGLDASSIISSDSGNLIQTGTDGLALVKGSGIVDPRADNLLETSSGGKLQVTVDRIAEWLDGHPQDAAVIADAINVVSGDSGNLIVEGTDKGAYLSKEAVASAVAAMTDAQKNALADAIAARIAADIADGKTIVASGGKLTADPTNATVAQKKAITTALAGGGLVVNSSTGRFDVDFESMDDTKFRRMMQGFIDKQTIKTANGGNHFYVDGSNANSSGDRDPTDADPRPNIGAPSDPFHTIQKCVDYITQVYKFADVNTYINCKNVSQTAMLSLPSFDRTTAEITIRSADFSSSTTRGQVASTSTTYDISITRSPTGGSRYAVDCTGTGVWNLRNFDAYCKDDDLDVSGGHLASLHVGDYAAVSIDYCQFKTRRHPDKPWLRSLTTGEHVLYISDYGYLSIGPHCTVIGNDLSTDPTTVASGEHAGTYHRGLNGMTIAGTGTVRINDTRDEKALKFSGNFDSIVYCTSYIVRNRAFMGVTNTSEVSNANYRFLFEYGGHGAIIEAGLIDSTYNDSSATDTWLGTVSTNQDTTSRISHVQTSTYSWYD